MKDHTQKMTFGCDSDGQPEIDYKLILLVNAISKIHCGSGWEFQIDGLCVDFCLNTFNVNIYYHYGSDDKELFEIYNEIKVGSFVCISGSSWEADDDLDGLHFYHPSYAVISADEIPQKIKKILMDNLCAEEMKYERIDKWGEVS